MKRLFRYVASILGVTSIIFSVSQSQLVQASQETEATKPVSVIHYKGEQEGFYVEAQNQKTNTDLFAEFKDVVPGDQRTQRIKIVNEASDNDYIRVYMQAVPHTTENPLSNFTLEEEETISQMNAFLSQLRMKVTQGNKVIFDASPDVTDGLKKGVFLGNINKNEASELLVSLEVPITLGNEFANRAGEVDWEFKIEAVSEEVLPPEEDYTTMTVHKVWQDTLGSQHDSITVDLLCNGIRVDSCVLGDENNWTYTWSYLSTEYHWTVHEIDIPSGYVASYAVSDQMTIITNRLESLDANSYTVEKNWVNHGHKQPDKAIVALYQGTTLYDTQELNEENQWRHTWFNLPEGSSWMVKESNIPKGYVADYSVQGNTTILTNTYDPEAAKVKKTLSVKKVWNEESKEHPEYIIVQLIRDGIVDAQVRLDDLNAWSYEFQNLDAAYNWNVREVTPEGYQATYSRSGDEIIITNKKTPPVALKRLAIQKVWDDNGLNTPKSVEVTLFKNGEAIDVVELNESNQWMHEWNQLDAAYDWTVIETGVPVGYLPSYHVDEDTVTITNTGVLNDNASDEDNIIDESKLVQTGQNHMLVWGLLCGGALLLLCGGVLIYKQRKDRNV